MSGESFGWWAFSGAPHIVGIAKAKAQIAIRIEDPPEKKNLEYTSSLMDTRCRRQCSKEYALTVIFGKYVGYWDY